MAKLHESPVCLAVLNPKGRDPFLDYREGVDAYRRGVHPPINFHAYAASTFGLFCDSVDQVRKHRSRIDAAVVLIRKRTWITLRAVRELKEAGIPVVVSWKECGPAQINRQLSPSRATDAYGEILKLADGIVSPTLACPPRCGEMGNDEFWRKMKFIPTPYPVEYPDWDFSLPLQERSGIMIGTREFRGVDRNHIQAILWLSGLARDLNLPRITVINSEKNKGMKKLGELSRLFPPNSLQILEKPLCYPDYLALLASHRLIFQMDRSGVPGQVAGDCLLAGNLCAGGDSAIESIAFPLFRDNGSARWKEVFEKIEQLMEDEKSYEKEVKRSQEIAAKELSFAAAGINFGKWLHSL